MAAPTRLTSTEDSITIAWTPPASNGGCTVTGYAVFVDDGSDGLFSEVNEEDDSNVRNIPGLSQLHITSPFTSAAAGTDYRIYVEVFNDAGSHSSEIATITLGDVPNPPQDVPRKVQAQSTLTSLYVEFDELAVED